MTLATPEGVRATRVTVRHGRPVGFGSLTFNNGLENYEIRADHLPCLADGHFAGPVPVVTADHGRIAIEYPLGLRLLRRVATTRLTLHSGVTWSLEVHSGAAHIDLDLTEGQLASAAFRGGLAHSKLALPEPDGQCLIRLGSARDIHLIRPSHVPVRIELDRGATDIRLDQRHHSAVGKFLADETPGYSETTNRYLLSARGGVAGLTITTADD